LGGHAEQKTSQLLRQLRLVLVMGMGMV